MTSNSRSTQVFFPQVGGKKNPSWIALWNRIQKDWDHVLLMNFSVERKDKSPPLCLPTCRNGYEYGYHFTYKAMSYWTHIDTNVILERRSYYLHQGAEFLLSQEGILCSPCGSNYILFCKNISCSILLTVISPCFSISLLQKKETSLEVKMRELF